MTLSSATIALTPLCESDLPILYAWINDRDHVLLNKPYAPVHENQHREWFEAIQRCSNVVVFGIRALENAESPQGSTGGRLIGSCQLHDINYVHRSAELQIRIGDASAQGKGYGTEAVRFLLRFAFRDLNLHRVYLHVFATNERAIHLYEKVGFVREGVLRQMAHIDGQYVDALVMAILREDYKDA
jgi:diamine N-acetyltransferase